MENSVVLIIGNKEDNFNSIMNTLKKADCRTIISHDLNCITDLISYGISDLLIIDDNFSELDQAFEILSNYKAPEMPVIFMGSVKNLSLESTYEIIDEVLNKPANTFEVLSRTRSLLEIRKMQIQLQTWDDTGQVKEDRESYSTRENINIKTKTRILVVEDSKLQCMIMCKNLGEENYDIITATSGNEAINKAHKTEPDLVILDVLLPDIDGFSVCEKLKSNPGTVNIPILIITSLEGISNKLKGLECGADDYLVKPIDKRELILRVNSLLRKKQLHDKLVKNYYDAWKQSIRDGLTNLFNHSHFMEQLNSEINRANRYKHRFSLVLLDIDYFKNYNDTNGHPAGDKVLKIMADILNSNTRNADIAARYGGEEFALILPETNKAGALRAAEKLRQAVENYPFPNQEKQPAGNLTISLGVSTYPDDATSGTELLNMADQALYKAKKENRNKCVLYGA